MPQKLSAMRYISNNKRRVSVLIVSLCLSFVIIYLTQFLLSTSEETESAILLDNSKKIQYVSLAGSSFGLDVDNLSYEELMPLYEQKLQELMKNLRTHEGVKKVYYAEILYASITPVVGFTSYEIPLVDKEELPVLMEHFNAELKEGRMPENPGEIVVDEATMKNNGYYLNDYLDKESIGEVFQIVGILEYDGYFGCGIPSDKYTCQNRITILSEGIDDMSAELLEEGITVRETYDTVEDYKSSLKELKEEVTEVIGNSTKYIYIGIVILLTIALFIVYTGYLNDRRNEWCLYCSIGYSRKSIYLSILRELLFTFTIALIIGVVLTIIGEIILNATMIQPRGLKCRYFYPTTIAEILCAYVLLFGILQIPIRCAMFKIRTIDAIGDDLY